MLYTIKNPPPGYDSCFARSYEDHDPECRGCEHRHECRPEFLKAAAQPPQPVYPSGPILRPYAGPSPSQPPFPTTPMYAQPKFVPPSLPTASPQTLQTQSVPSTSIVGQYPGETVIERVVKNVILRMVEAFFGELWRFFHTWTWPKKVAR